MKRYISIMIALSMIFATLVPCSAVANDDMPEINVLHETTCKTDSGYIQTSELVVEGVRYASEIRVFNTTNPNEYRVIQISSGTNDVAKYDTRNDYVEWNHEKIYFTKQNASETEILRAARPTTIDHGLSIAKGWMYSASSWTNYKLDRDAHSMAVSVLAAIIVGAVTGGIGSSVAVAVAVGLISSKSGPFDNFWVRKYTYGYSPMVSTFAYIEQVYNPDYVAIEGSSTKSNPNAWVDF